MCGSVEWVFVNSTYQNYFVNGKCQDENPFTSIQSVACACPLPASIKPCTCEVAPSDYGTGALKIDCSSKSLNDSQAKTIITNIPPTTPVAAMDLSSNQLTVVPQGLPKFTSIFVLSLRSNQITIIKTANLALNSSNFRQLDLSSNPNLATIEEASLPG